MLILFFFNIYILFEIVYNLYFFEDGLFLFNLYVVKKDKVGLLVYF